MGISSFRMAREAEERGDVRIENIDTVERLTVNDVPKASQNLEPAKKTVTATKTKKAAVSVS